jgi:hypothetical protein
LADQRDAGVAAPLGSRHELLFQRCRSCGAAEYYPRGVSRAHCWSAEELPYVLAWDELDEGLQVPTNLVDCDPAEVAIGMPVEVTFEDVTPGLSIPRFRPAGRLTEEPRAT